MFVQASLRRAIAASLFCAASFTLMPNTSSAAALAKQPIQPKQTKFELLTTFGRGSLDGQEPIGVVATANGNLWGTAIGGQFEGIIFEMSAAGGRRNIFDFTSNGPTIGGPSTPFLGPDGNNYGTTGSTTGQRSFGSTRRRLPFMPSNSMSRRSPLKRMRRRQATVHIRCMEAARFLPHRIAVRFTRTTS